MSMLTLNYKGVDLDIHYDYQPEEKEVRYYSDGSGYPGCPESLDITAIYLNGTNVTELLEDQLDKIYDAMEEYRESRKNNY